MDSAATLPVALTPFYRTHKKTYSVYFDVVTQAELDARIANANADREATRRMEAATVGLVQAGNDQSEREFNYQTDKGERPVIRTNGRTGRGGAGWFSYDLPVDASGQMQLVVTYFNEVGLPPARGDFQILVEGTPIATFTPNESASGFFNTRYAIPTDLTVGKSKVTVKFQATPTGRFAPVYAVRTVRGS
jgi:hypothetical protein